MIVKGKVLTTEGPIDIDKLKIGDQVLDLYFRKRTITNITPEVVKRVNKFKINSNLVLSQDTVLVTQLGDYKKNDRVDSVVYPLNINKTNTMDIIYTEETDTIGYKVEIDNGDSIYVENYTICIKEV